MNDKRTADLIAGAAEALDHFTEDELELHAEKRARRLQASPESTGPSTTRPGVFALRQAVVLRKGRRQLLAIVAHISVAAVGLPGPHRYRYNVKPARIQDGCPVPIEAFRWLAAIRGDQLEAYDETTHGGNLAKWRVL